MTLPTPALDIPGLFPDRARLIPLAEAFQGRRFATITIDPPWQYGNWTLRKNGATPYSTLSLDELARLPVGELAARDSKILLWATGPKLDGAIELIARWNFVYTTVALAWEKLTRSGKPALGPGWHSKPSVELLLLGKRGKGSAIDRTVPQLLQTEEEKDLPEVLSAPARGHSVKPDEAYARIERLYPGPYLDIFARRPRRGWEVWGDEVGPFAPAPTPVPAPAEAEGGAR